MELWYFPYASHASSFGSSNKFNCDAANFPLFFCFFSSRRVSSMLPSASPAWPYPKGGIPEPFPGLRKFSRLLQFRFTLTYLFHSSPFPEPAF
jgi:hypothetical protein